MPRISMPNGCSISEPNVNPRNWKTLSASCKKDWYINYRFYDPEREDTHPGGKLVIVKGMNAYKTVIERQSSTRSILAEMMSYLEQGFNPIADAVIPEKNVVRTEPVMPEDGLWRGIIFARTKRTYAPATAADVDSYLRRLLKSAQALGLHIKPLGLFRRRDLLAILDRMDLIKPWSPHTFNNCLGYLRPLFVILNKYEAMEVNPADGIEKMEVPDTVRTLLTEPERRLVDDHLCKHYRRFWLFVNIFFHSGAREIELLAVRRDDVDLAGQTFTVITRKGKKKLPRPEVKIIKDVAVPYWQEYLEDGKDGEYLFCKGWLSGSKPMTRDWLTHLWGKVVKIELGINADLYSLKHLHFDEATELTDISTAAAHAGHTSTRMGEKHYAVGEKGRRLERLKKLPNTFAG